MSTNNWDVARPPDATTVSATIGTEIIRAKTDIEERMMQGGHKFAGIVPPAASANQNSDGKHAIGYETQSNQNDSGFYTAVWSFDGSTPYLRIYGSTHATQPLQIEALNGAKFVGPNVTSGTDPGHLHTQGGIIGGRGGTILATGYLKGSAFRWAKGATEGTQTITRLGARVATAPSGGNLVLEIRRTTGAPANNADVYSDGVADKVIGTITILSGEFYGSTTVLANQTLADGETIVPKVTTLTGSPADLSIDATITG